MCHQVPYGMPLTHMRYRIYYHKTLIGPIVLAIAHVAQASGFYLQCVSVLILSGLNIDIHVSSGYVWDATIPHRKYRQVIQFLQLPMLFRACIVISVLHPNAFYKKTPSKFENCHNASSRFLWGYVNPVCTPAQGFIVQKYGPCPSSSNFPRQSLSVYNTYMLMILHCTVQTGLVFQHSEIVNLTIVKPFKGAILDEIL